MKTETRNIIPIDVPALPPIWIAMTAYLKWKSDVPFIQDLAHYLERGVVISRPDIFGMAKVVDLSKMEDGRSEMAAPISQLPTPNSQPDRAWFVRMAVGPLDRLVWALPARLPKICFCRRNDGRLRVYSLDRLLKLSAISNKPLAKD